ncbi:hypothetical protein FBUS_08720 [Fasciolopsis buskii]|uniref:Uncharacterized protein n=1 Tax=Fasciolopsis buskii TaxID=27845 RepID=A0A8E0RZX6_9TREM|nr:hypothetical protein FBUS_08720 [Fasciolopsis buski]
MHQTHGGWVHMRQDNIEPHLPYSTKKRKGWLLFDEVCKEVRNRQDCTNQLIFVSEWNPYFSNKSNQFVHNPIETTKKIRQCLRRRANDKSCVCEMIRNLEMNPDGEKDCPTRPCNGKRQRQHKNHHKPHKKNPSTEGEQEVSENKQKCDKSIVSIELEGGMFRLKSILYRDPFPPWNNLKQIMKRELQQDIKEGMGEFVEHRSVDDRKIHILDDDHDLTTNQSENDDINRDDSFDAVSQVTEPSRLSILFVQSFDDEHTLSSSWFIVQMPEILPVDIRNAVHTLGINPNLNISYLSFFSPILVVIRLTTLLDNSNGNGDLYMVIEQIEKKRNAVLNDNLYAIQLQYFCPVTDCRKCRDLIRPGNPTETLGDHSQCSQWQQFRFTQLTDLILSAVETCAVKGLIHSRNMMKIGYNGANEHGDKKRENFSCHTSDDSIVIIDWNDINQDCSQCCLDNPIPESSCQLCSDNNDTYKEFTAVDYPELERRQSVRAICSAGHWASPECIRSHSVEFLNPNFNLDPTELCPRIPCPIVECKQFINRATLIHTIPARYFFPNTFAQRNLTFDPT